VLIPYGLGAGGDDFRAEVYFTQTIPEPVSAGLIILGGLSIMFVRRLKRPF
jgi:hypothetical protein